MNGILAKLPYATKCAFAHCWPDLGRFVQVKILVVEDEPFIRLGLVSTIEEAGYEVIDAASTDEAIRKLERYDDVGLILTDVDMPGSMDGIRLAHYVRRRWPPIELVVISGKVGVTPMELPSGARFISKPFQDVALMSVVQTMLGAEGTSE